MKPTKAELLRFNPERVMYGNTIMKVDGFDDSIIAGKYIDASIDGGFGGFGWLSLDEIKPIVRSLWDMGRTIKHKGKLINPLVELAKISFGSEFDFSVVHFFIEDNKLLIYIDSVLQGEFYLEDESFIHYSFIVKEALHVKNQRLLFDFMYEMQFDLPNWLDDEYAVEMDLNGEVKGNG